MSNDIFFLSMLGPCILGKDGLVSNYSQTTINPFHTRIVLQTYTIRDVNKIKIKLNTTYI